MHNLSKREKLLLKILLSVIAATAFYLLILKPLILVQNKEVSKAEYSGDSVRKLETIYKKYKETVDLKNKLNNSIKNSSGITSIVNEISNSVNILKNRTDMKEYPGKIQNGIQRIKTVIKYEGISINSFLRLIEQLENSSTYIKVKKVKLYPSIKSKQNIYDVNIEIVSFIKK